MNIHDSLGFGPNNYITIFKGVTKEYEQWFRELPARYSKYWGWYLPESESISSLPFGVEPVRLSWDEVSVNDSLKPDKELRDLLDSKLYVDDGSEYLGEVGQEVQTAVVIRKAVPVKTNFGDKTMYVMDDFKGNHVIWVTTVGLLKDTIYYLEGEVQRQSIYHNSKQTTLKKVKCTMMEKKHEN